jgi:hypothetical protein
MSWVTSDEDRDIYAEAFGKNADSIILASKRSTLVFLEAKRSLSITISSGKLTPIHHQ